MYFNHPLTLGAHELSLSHCVQALKCSKGAAEAEDISKDWSSSCCLLLLPCQVVANLFFGYAQLLAQQQTVVGKNSTVTRRYKAPTVAAKFQQSLLHLVEKMER